MQIVIEISEEDKKELDDSIKGKGFSYFEKAKLIRKILFAVFHGKVIPKGHGRLKDIDKIEWYGCTTEFYCPHKDRECKDCDRAECSKTQVDAIPTIIDADRSEQE